MYLVCLERREGYGWQRSELRKMNHLTVRFVGLSVSVRDPAFRPSFARENAMRSRVSERKRNLKRLESASISNSFSTEGACSLCFFDVYIDFIVIKWYNYSVIQLVSPRTDILSAQRMPTASGSLSFLFGKMKEGI